MSEEQIGDPEHLDAALHHWISQAEAHDLSGDLMGSLEDLKHALTIARDKRHRAFIRAMMSLLYCRQKNPLKGLWCAAAAIDDDRNAVIAQFAFGVACCMSSFNRLAIEAFQQVLDSDPAHPQSLLYLGISLREACRIEEAIAQLKKYVVLRPNDPVGFNELGWSYSLGAIALHKPHYQSLASDAFHLALKCNPSESLKRRINERLEGVG